MSEANGRQDAITEEEMQGTTVPASTLPEVPTEEPKDIKVNACTACSIDTICTATDTITVAELMKPKSKKSTEVPDPKHKKKPIIFLGRDGLGAYTEHHEAFPKELIFQDESFVAITDKFPKSAVHTLLLPRGPVNLLQPFEAFNDPVFLEETRERAAKLKKIVAKELRRKLGKFSAQDQARERVLNGEVELDDGEELPPGRDWEKEVEVGIHMHPSMNHLHIHVLSRDNQSVCMKNRNHYNSFNTPFFCKLDEFPLTLEEKRGREHQHYLEKDLICWRCGNNFGKSMAKLKTHLADEFEEWKKE